MARKARGVAKAPIILFLYVCSTTRYITPIVHAKKTRDSYIFERGA